LTKLPAALAGLSRLEIGAIVIDATIRSRPPLFKPFDLRGRVSSEVVADLGAGRAGRKAFIICARKSWLRIRRIAAVGVCCSISGDDAAAKAEIAALIDRIEFTGIGSWIAAVGGKLAQFPGGPLPNQNLVKVA